ncbi:glycosyltransferase [Chlorobaculum sp. 24CR]|uniref:glycosyltransferase family 4 protein n=1 Tax=Chlorobaculum sp. 24CR TaxID=2508878 RepID=UPI00100A865C|nr:glycosyltransferase family 4 protein [Chlorobaculum sp. 24CR]RXK88059.1 glycosyltransferase [Chlorobaculum sp. 24CR]
MKILWITNIVFPEPSKTLNIPASVTGGWMYGLLEQIKKEKEIDIAVATVYGGSDYVFFDICGVKYYLLPCDNNLRYNKSLKRLWKEVFQSYMPDLVHIHGTEFPHGLACIHSSKNEKFVVSIQGLVSVIERYYYAGISLTGIVKNITIRDVVKRDTIINAKKKFIKRGWYEKEYIKKAGNVIGRTEWDKAHTKAINKSVVYYHCDEILRGEFYVAKKWDINNIKRNTIFLSQAGYPIKGLHQVLKAVSLIKDEYPDIKINIAGTSIIRAENIKDKIRISGYGLYIKRLIKKLKLNENVIFKGLLNESEMRREYLAAHIFICPSSIENSPNSVGEAQILGVPTIAANVGGVQDMIKHHETGILYRFEEVEMLAEYIRMIFTDDLFAMKLSSQGIMSAEKRHDKINNVTEMIKIYKSICSP